MDLRKEFEKDHPIPAKLTNLPNERHFSPEYVEWLEQRLKAGRHEMIIVPQKILRLLIDLEWSSSQKGQGSGFMSSGGDGPMIRACPICKGIDPSDDKAVHFISSAHGHRPDCRIAQMIQALNTA